MYQVYKSKEVTILMNGILLDKNICFDTYTCAGQFVMLFGTEGQDFACSVKVATTRNAFLYPAAPPPRHPPPPAGGETKKSACFCGYVFWDLETISIKLLCQSCVGTSSMQILKFCSETADQMKQIILTNLEAEK